MLLSGKTALISGAAGPRGIGYAAARLFAEQGARVAILDIDGTAAEAAAKGLGPDHLGLLCDITDPEACRRSASAAIVWRGLGGGFEGIGDCQEAIV